MAQKRTTKAVVSSVNSSSPAVALLRTDARVLTNTPEIALHRTYAAALREEFEATRTSPRAMQLARARGTILSHIEYSYNDTEDPRMRNVSQVRSGLADSISSSCTNSTLSKELNGQMPLMNQRLSDKTGVHVFVSHSDWLLNSDEERENFERKFRTNLKNFGFRLKHTEFTSNVWSFVILDRKMSHGHVPLGHIILKIRPTDN